MMLLSEEKSMRETVSAMLSELPTMKVRSIAAGRWSLEAECMKGRRVDVALCEDNWLVFTEEIARGSIHGVAVQRCAWEVLRVNGELAGAAKIVLSPGRDRLSVVRELWVEPAELGDEAGGAAMADRVREAVDDLCEVHERARNGARAGKTWQRNESAEVDLVELSQMAGWPCNRRGDGRVTVQLDVPGAYALAMLRPGARASAIVEIPLPPGLSEASRQAVGMVLLHVGGLVRCVRGAICAGAPAEASEASAAFWGHWK
jgi:hypothetical protein